MVDQDELLRELHELDARDADEVQFGRLEVRSASRMTATALRAADLLDRARVALRALNYLNVRHQLELILHTTLVNYFVHACINRY